MRQSLVNGLKELLRSDLAGQPFIAACGICHARDPLTLVAVKPRLNSPPGKLPRVAVLIRERQSVLTR